MEVTERAASALVVAVGATSRGHLAAVASSLGFRTTLAAHFGAAKYLLETRPHLLLTEVRLHEYNGLHLVAHACARRATTAAVVLWSDVDAWLQHDAEAMGATFVEASASRSELAAAIVRTLVNAGRRRYEPIRPPFERRQFPGFEYTGSARGETRRRPVHEVIDEALRTMTYAARM